MVKISKNKAIAFGLVAVFIGIAAGCTAPEDNNTATTDNPKTNTVQTALPSTTTKAADLRVLLNALERQHVNLTSAALRSGFDDGKDFKAVTASLDENSVALAEAVGSIYGADAKDKSLALWRNQISFLTDYALAVKAGDKKKMDETATNLNGSVDGIADFFAKANPNLPKEAVKELFSQHVTLLKDAVDAYGAGDYAKSYAKQAAADQQVGTIANTTADAIVRQYPEKF